MASLSNIAIATTYALLFGPLNKSEKEIANEFYTRIKDKPFKVIKKFHDFISPKGFLDHISFRFDKERKARYAAVGLAMAEMQFSYAGYRENHIYRSFPSQ